MRREDWSDVRAIFEQGIASGNATFESELPGWVDWDAAHLDAPRLVATRAGRIIGWAALSPASHRDVYAGVAEVSLYVAEDARGRGVGKRLLEGLVSKSELAGIWTLQAGIFPENEVSLALHQACGFRIVGRREKLAQLRGRWRDVLLLERRSASVGSIDAD